MTYPTLTQTVWNDVPETVQALALALRLRVSWVTRRMETWAPSSLDYWMTTSTAGRSWVSTAELPIHGTNHTVAVEFEEGLPSRNWAFDPSRPYADRLRGPSFWVGLRQDGVDSSEHFDWIGLKRAFDAVVLDATGHPIDGRPWARTPAGLRDAGDRHRRDEVGLPKWLGKGFGMAQTKYTRQCMFGARLSMAPTSTLAEVERQIQDVVDLMTKMAIVLNED